MIDFRTQRGHVIEIQTEGRRIYPSGKFYFHEYSQLIFMRTNQMMVDKPVVKADSYRGDRGRDTVQFLTPRGFRFISTKKEKL